MGFLFSGSGRLRRTHYALGGLLAWGAALLIWAIAVGLGLGASQLDPSAPQVIMGLWSAGLIVLAFVVLLWAFVALTAKRLHDIGQSGWWTLLVLLPGIGAFALFLILCFLPGNEGPNRYGPDPREPLLAKLA